jgi:HK97 family phage major capsid protein
MMNRKTAAVVRKLKEATSDQYLWSPGLISGQPDQMLGYPVLLAEEMPDVAANSLSIAFGNFQAGYTIIRQPGIRMLTDPYTDKPNVRLAAYERVGGGVTNSEAIKVIKFSAT